MTFRRIACVLVVIALVAAGLSVESKILIRKESARRVRAFYKEESNFDVLFLGNSHVMNGIVPLELWNDYGLASYNMGMSGGRLSTSYWSLMAALQYTEPKLVVLDCAYMGNKKKYHRTLVQRLFDAMPMSPVKLQAAFDLFEDRLEVFEKVLFPFARYHSRWYEVNKKDFFPSYPNLMGYSLKAGAVQVKRPQALMAESPKPVKSVNMDYLDRIIEECKARDIQLLLTYIPFREGESDQNEAGYLGVVARERGLDYLTPTELEEAIDWNTDFANGDNKNNSHLNCCGAKKLTRFFGQYIADHYNLPDHRSDDRYAHWNGYYRDSLDYEDQALREADRWKQALSLLGNERYSLVVAVNDPSLWSNGILAAQMNNVGLGTDAVKDAPALYMAGKSETALRFEPSELTDQGVATSLGQLGRMPVQAETGSGYAVTLEGETLFTVSADAPDGLQIAVLDRESGALVHSFGVKKKRGKLLLADD